MSVNTNLGWQSAPPFNKITASQQGGNRGVQLWGVQDDGALSTIYQVSPGGGWSQWLDSSWAGSGFPPQVDEMTAVEQSNSCVQFWGLDTQQQLWSTYQTSPGGNWAAWSGPNWNDAPKGLKKIASSQLGGSLSVQLWGITEDFSLTTCYQVTPDRPWSLWQGWAPTLENSQFIQISAAQQNDGRVQLWAIDTKGQLWSCWQISSDGRWGPWSGPNWNGAPANLSNLIACQQGGSRGAQLWVITSDHTLISNYQTSHGDGWSGWSSGSWSGAPQVFELAAAQQNNGCVQFWALNLNQELISISQTSPGGNWGEWS